MPEPPLFSLEDSLAEDLKAIAHLIEGAALKRQHDSLALLDLLRLLEHLHREVRDSLFRDALPTNRQNLYALLRDIEVQGGWPYIQRMKLKALLDNYFLAAEAEIDTPEEDPSRS